MYRIKYASNGDGEIRIDEGKLNELLHGSVTLEENENEVIQKEVIRQQM